MKHNELVFYECNKKVSDLVLKFIHTLLLCKWLNAVRPLSLVGRWSINVSWVLGRLRWFTDSLCVCVCVLVSLEILGALLSSLCIWVLTACWCTWRGERLPALITRSVTLMIIVEASSGSHILCKRAPHAAHEACQDRDLCWFCCCYCLFLIPPLVRMVETHRVFKRLYDRRSGCLC